MCWTRPWKAHPAVPDCIHDRLDDFRYFLAVLAEARVLAAAERLGVKPLDRACDAIAQLEEERLGVHMFESCPFGLNTA